jgi:polyisoprenoid-binding protein YceI
LRIDTPEGRKKTRLDPDGPSTDDVLKIQEKMLASQDLAAEEHPDIEFRSASVESSRRQSLLLWGILTIRGDPKRVSIPISFNSLDGQQYRFSGQFPIRQSDYGIKPESIGGVVNVKDEVTVYLDVYAASTAKICQ